MLKDSLISDLSTVYSLYTNTRAKCSVVYLKNKRTSFHLDYKIYLGNNDMVWIRNLLLNTFLYMKFFVCVGDNLCDVFGERCPETEKKKKKRQGGFESATGIHTEGQSLISTSYDRTRGRGGFYTPSSHHPRIKLYQAINQSVHWRETFQGAATAAAGTTRER